MHYNIVLLPKKVTNCISYFFVSNVLGCAGLVCFYYEKRQM